VGGVAAVGVRQLWIIADPSMPRMEDELATSTGSSDGIVVLSSFPEVSPESILGDDCATRRALSDGVKFLGPTLRTIDGDDSIVAQRLAPPLMMPELTENG